MGDFGKLEVWRKSQRLVSSIYRLTGTLPNAERYGLTSQMRRAAVSVSANLAEGCGRMGDAELKRFYELVLARSQSSNVSFLSPQTYISSEVMEEVHSIRGMLQSLHRALS